MNNSRQSDAKASPLRIMLIDDDPNDRTLVIRALKKDFPGVQVEEIIEAEGLKKALDEHNFDLVITDYHLYWTNGIKNLMAIKERYPECPVIMFTGTGTEEVAVEAMKAGLDDYVLKAPKHFGRLPATIRSLLEHAHQRRIAREAENHVRQLQKMDSLGALAGGIAHDFNNIMTAIGSYAELALMQIPDDSPAYSDLEGVTKSVARAITLTKQLSSFSRKQEIKLKEVDCNALISNMQQMLERLVRKNIVLKNELTEESTLVMAQPGELEQVLMNLSINARDAMPDGGEFTIRTRVIQLPLEEPGPEVQLTPGSYVMIEAIDTGCGMAPEIVSHAFEPLFTTKLDEEGTGLGLAIAYVNISHAKGSIRIDSTPGKGTKLSILLPRAG
jgi:two-component system, cell cycle sensor histidine kinase and response regulator CckA